MPFSVHSSKEEDHKAVCTDKVDTKESFFYTIGSKHFWSRVENSFLQGFCLKIYVKKKELVSWQSQPLWFFEIEIIQCILIWYIIRNWWNKTVKHHQHIFYHMHQVVGNSGKKIHVISRSGIKGLTTISKIFWSHFVFFFTWSRMHHCSNSAKMAQSIGY